MEAVKVKKIESAHTYAALPADFDAKKWLADQSDYRWLLAHAYDGVIWGAYRAGSWVLSGTIDGSLPQLDTRTLLELRLFDFQKEAFVWRGEDGWQLRLIQDAVATQKAADYTYTGRAYYDEPQILYGTQGMDKGQDFTLLEDGQQGLAHLVPLPLGDYNAKTKRIVTLEVRHYVDRDDETGLAKVAVSRLLNLDYDQAKLAEVKNNGS